MSTAARRRSAALFIILSLVSCGDPDRVEVVRTAPSPDSALVARAYVISGGGAAGWVYLRLDLRPHGDSFRADRSYVFSMKAHPYDVLLSWSGPRELLVEYPADAAVGGARRMKTEQLGVHITYTPTYRSDSAHAGTDSRPPAT